jgi:putative RNA 2'-phosphotransferase
MNSNYFDVTRASKFLSYVLRHRPDSIGIILDKEGWVAVSDLLAKAAAAGTFLTAGELKRIVDENDKKRFVLNDDSTRIRAAQGHSVDVDLKLPVKAPPPVLYHGTVEKFMGAIRIQGLRPMSRHDVHLSPDRETATRVATRRGRPVILVIETYPLVRDGYQFRVSDNGVWLVSKVPANYIKFSDEH